MSNADLAAEIAEHRLCTLNGRCGQEGPHCARCRQDWPCLVWRLTYELEEMTDAYHFWAQAHDEQIDRAMDAEARERRLADEHAGCTNLSQAEAARIFEEAWEMRARAERAEADLAAALRREAALREALEWAEALEAWSTLVLSIVKDRRIPSVDVINDGERIAANVRAVVALREPPALPPAWLQGEQAALNALRCAAHGMKLCGACRDAREPHPPDEGKT